MYVQWHYCNGGERALFREAVLAVVILHLHVPLKVTLVYVVWGVDRT